MLRLVIVAVVTIASPCSAADVIGQATVIDGDIIEIHGQRIRLYGIDAPESEQQCLNGNEPYRCGQQAALALADHIGRQTVNCEYEDMDRYGGMVASCTAGGDDLGAWLVENGWALAYRRYSTAYVGQEKAAE